MSNEEIKADCEAQYEAIRKAEERLNSLRTLCPHDTVFHGYYSYRVGVIMPAIICSSCGSFIRQAKDTDFEIVQPKQIESK